jgi:hypothetical protein
MVLERNGDNTCVLIGVLSQPSLDSTRPVVCVMNWEPAACLSWSSQDICSMRQPLSCQSFRKSSQRVGLRMRTLS